MKPLVNLDARTESRELNLGGIFAARLFPIAPMVGATSGRVPATWPPQASFQSKFFVESAHVDYWQGE
ncbi:MAG TPA: hypothetical protein VFV17_08750 [Usitatibacteraceae bacterium]|nr:hypothetical protein [Usitatibacteraceae bacterium]